MVEERKREYRANGISYYRPWIFLITDGAPTDEWQAAANKVFQGKKIRSLPSLPSAFRADMKTLAQISVRQPLPLQGLQFRELFSWLSSSLRSVSRSTPGTEVVLEAPKAGRQCELATGLCISRWNVAHQCGLALPGCLPDTGCPAK